MVRVSSHHHQHAGDRKTASAAGHSSASAYSACAAYGVLAMLALLGLYFGVLTLVSGWEFTAREFSRFWHFVLPLAAGFGAQVALFTRLRTLAGKSKESGTIVAASGTTSTAAMVSCCAHYLVNVAPVLGATGLVALAAQFQVELFWVGLAFSAAGIGFVLTRVLKAEKEHAKCVA
jgi:Cu+-exporting ATPase